MSIVVNLPALNGNYEVGIAVGTDAALAEEKKLNLYASSTCTAIWAWDRFASSPIRAHYAAAAYVCHSLAFCRTVGTSNDKCGDYIKVKGALQVTEVLRVALEAAITSDVVLCASTVIIATKANFWATNHHTGQGGATGYIKKVLDLKMPNVAENERTEYAHTVGHWASTRYILSLALIGGIRTTQPAFEGPKCTLVLTTDAKQRFSSMPAGTHRLAVSIEAAKRLLRTNLARACPEVADFVALPAMRDAVVANPALYHVGGAFLCGVQQANGKQAFNDTDVESMMGRLGTFVISMLGKSSLAKSPHFSEAKVTSYDDYSSEWRAYLDGYRRLANQGIAKGYEHVGLNTEGVTEEEIKRMNAVFLPVVQGTSQF